MPPLFDTIGFALPVAQCGHEGYNRPSVPQDSPVWAVRHAATGHLFAYLYLAESAAQAVADRFNAEFCGDDGRVELARCLESNFSHPRRLRPVTAATAETIRAARQERPDTE